MARTSDGKCHLLLSVWPEEGGFESWVMRSKIGYAVADSPEATYRYQGIVFDGSHAEGGWDRDVVHNPDLRQFNGKFYLYYTGNFGDGSYWGHRQNQRIGVAVAESPAGPWCRFDKPLMDVDETSWSKKLTANPSVCQTPSGDYLMVYKTVDGRAPGPLFGPVRHGVALAKSPLGPFCRHGKPVFVKEGVNFAAEDPFVFSCGGKLLAILKDHGRFYNPTQERSWVLFESEGGLDWRPLTIIRRAITG